MASSYDPKLVVLSIVIACMAGYAALQLAGHVAMARARIFWLVAAAFAMGTGIWSMHFIAMLAYRLPVGVGFSVPLVALSMGIAFAASAVGLDVAGSLVPTRGKVIRAGLLMGVAIAGM